MKNLSLSLSNVLIDDIHLDIFVFYKKFCALNCCKHPHKFHEQALKQAQLHQALWIFHNYNARFRAYTNQKSIEYAFFN